MSLSTNASDIRLAETIFSLRFETMPVWIDDRRLVFLDDRSGVMHLFVGDVTTGERWQLTRGTERIQSLHATPGSGRVLVGTDAGGNERQQLAVIDVDSGERRQLTHDPERIHEPFLIGSGGRFALYRTNDGASGEFSLYRVDLDSGEATCLWDDAGQVRAHAIDDDGRVLASLFTSNLDADLYLIEPDGSRRAVLQVADESWIVDAAFTAGSGRALVLTNAGRDFVALESVDLKGDANWTTVLATDADIEAMALTSDGDAMALAVNRDGYSEVWLGEVAAPDALVRAELPDGVADRLAWSPDATTIAVGWTPTDRPARIQLVDRDGAARQAFPDELDDALFMGRSPELIAFETWDGRDIPAFWYQGDRADAPVVVDVHGGPESQRRAAFHPVLQYLAASGFHVLTTNVRGSTGYGKAYSHLDDVELRMDSVRDLEHAHAWVRSRLGPEAKIAIMGQSYGGFMTLAAITEYPDLWFAAVDVVGISNFVSFLERTGPWRRRHRSAEYGSLERDRALLERISPIRKVDRIEAPLFVIHGRNDPRVPLYETEQLVESLERRRHPVEMLVFDNEGHGLSKRPNRIEGYAAVVSFLQDIADRRAEA
jgi:dipeptidyl aminopeptidase/acylaminoacyl peptidase